MEKVVSLRPELFEDAFHGVYKGSRVLVTGHNGFKGGWLCQWLTRLGARLTGFSLPPTEGPSLFRELKHGNLFPSVEGDIRDLAAVKKVVAETSPDVVFHLAAQSLVRSSYERPVETYEVNVLGTVNVLEAVRAAERPCAVVCVTSDKCYENREWLHAYREEDPLGGHDPYSSSKAAAEIAIAAYRRSFFLPDRRIGLASARAGNVIGGGDWAADRIVPDCMRALDRGESIPVRNKTATRPWQHVLEPLSGYLWLGALLQQASAQSLPVQFNRDNLCGAFNFGPFLDSNRTVADLVAEVLKHRSGRMDDRSNPNAPHEAGRLNLTIDKAVHLLGWEPLWSFEKAVAMTVEWYNMTKSQDAVAVTDAHIFDYQSRAREKNVGWIAPLRAT